jgi:hypothetical protein
VQVELTGFGRQSARDAGGFAQGYSVARQMIASDSFAAAFPRAFGPWADAEGRPLPRIECFRPFHSRPNLDA